MILRLGAVEVDSAAEALRILSAVPSAGDIEMDYVTGEETPNADHLRALVQIDAEAHAPERRKGLLRVLWDNVPLRIGNALWGLVVAVQWTFLFLLAVSLRVIKAGLFVTVVPPTPENPDRRGSVPDTRVKRPDEFPGKVNGDLLTCVCVFHHRSRFLCPAWRVSSLLA